VNVIAHLKDLKMNLENQYAVWGLFGILKIKVKDYGLKSCMVGQKCKNNITGRSPQERGIANFTYKE
jgi:hypothetical protein